MGQFIKRNFVNDLLLNGRKASDLRSAGDERRGKAHARCRKPAAGCGIQVEGGLEILQIQREVQVVRVG